MYVCVLSLDIESLRQSPLLTIAFLPLYHKVCSFLSWALFCSLAYTAGISNLPVWFLN